MSYSSTTLLCHSIHNMPPSIDNTRQTRTHTRAFFGSPIPFSSAPYASVSAFLWWPFQFHMNHTIVPAASKPQQYCTSARLLTTSLCTSTYWLVEIGECELVSVSQRNEVTNRRKLARYGTRWMQCIFRVGIQWNRWQKLSRSPRFMCGSHVL